MKYVAPINGDLANSNRPFVDGNPAQGVEGSIPPAAAIEHPMREIVAAIEAAGLTPDGEQLNQLAQAIVKLAGVRFKGFEVAGTHTAYEGDLDAIVHNSLYACDSATVQNAPDLPTGTWAYVHTMVLPLDAGRTQLCWTADDPDHPGWNRRRTGAGVWSSWKEIGSGGGTGVAVGDLCWSTTGTPSPGCVAANVKQKFTRELYPQLVARVLADGGYLATEAAWDAEAAAQEGSCGRFALTDTYIILPCYRHYFAAAQNGVAGKGVGDWVNDAIRNIEAAWSGANWAQTESGAVFRDSTIGGYTTNASVQATTGTHFSADRVVPTAEENRPKTVYVLPCIKVADVAVNASQVDMLALAGQVAQINGDKVDKGDAEYRSIVELKGSRSTTGTWTVSGLLAGKPLYLIMNVSNTSTAYRVVSGAIGATGSSVQQFIFLSGSSQGSTNATIVIPIAAEVVLEIGTIYSGGTIYAYQ